jgi:hypothetical protein
MMRKCRLLILFFFVALAVACQDSAVRQAKTSTPQLYPGTYLAIYTSIPASELQLTAPDIARSASGIPTKLIKRGKDGRRISNDDAVILQWQVYNSAGAAVERGSELLSNQRTYPDSLLMMGQGEVRRFWFRDPANARRLKVTDYEVVWISPETSSTRPK